MARVGGEGRLGAGWERGGYDRGSYPYPDVFVDHIDICHLPLHVIRSWIGCSDGFDNGSSSDPSHRGESEHGSEDEVRARGNTDDLVGVGFTSFEKGMRRPSRSDHHHSGSTDRQVRLYMRMRGRYWY